MLLNLLVSLTEKFYDKSLPVIFDKDKCIHQVKGYNCLRCMESCPSQSISYDEDEGLIINSSCTGCSVCVRNCTGGALKDTLQGSFLKVTESSESDGKLSLFCEKKEKVYGVKVKCLFNIHLFQLIELYSRLGKKINIDLSQCTHCPNRLKEDVENFISDTNQWNNLLPTQWIELSLERGEEKGEEISRDELFKIFKNSTKKEVLDKFQSEIEGNNRRNLILSKAIDRLQAEGLLSLVDGRVFNENCRVCGKCASLCIGEAIEIRESESTVTIDYDFHKCVNCLRCIKHCPVDGIEKSHNIKSKKELGGSRCSLCGTIIDSGKMCTRCQSKRRI